MILLPKFKDLIIPEPITVHTGFAGMYKFEALNVETGRTRLLADWFPNLMLTAGLNTMATSTAYGNICHVGSGNTPPIASDTQLDVPVPSGETIYPGYPNSGGSSDGITPPHFAEGYRSYTFPQALTGNLTEVGVGNTTASGAPLLSRSLILDGSLVPTTITVLAIEILTVSYTLRGYAPTNDLLGTVTIDGVVYNTITRLAKLTASSASAFSWQGGMFKGIAGESVVQGHRAYTGNLGLVTSEPTGFIDSPTTSQALAYVDLTFSRDYEVFYDVNDGNGGGIRSVHGSTDAGGQFQTQFNGPADETIPKDNNKTLKLTFRHTWGPYVP